VQNGELNPCCRQEKLKEVLLGHQPYRMAKALGDYSMVEKHETSEPARLVVVQDPRDTVKAGLPESQSPGMEAHIHRHGMYGRCPWNRTVSLSSSELFLQGTTVSEIVQGDEQDTCVALSRSTRTDTGSPTGREAHGDGAVVAVRGRESRPHGEGPQVPRWPKLRGSRNGNSRNSAGRLLCSSGLFPMAQEDRALESRMRSK